MQLHYKKTAGVTKNQEQTTLTRLKPYISQLTGVAKKNNYENLESSINCPFDSKLVKQVKKLAKQKVSKKLTYIVVIGIGGSNLGTKAIYDALRGYTDSLVLHDKHPKLLFVDTVNEKMLTDLTSFFKKEKISSQEILLCSISKSGGTAETLANTEILLGKLGEFIDNITDRLVVITNKESNYWNAAVKRNISVLPIPELVGGRYSIFSAVGLFPLAAAGFNIDDLLKGAKEMRDVCINKTVTKNLAAISATILYHQIKKQRVINDNFVFHSELESLGKWYRQLMGESIGKEKNKQGKVVHVGLTPTVSVGSTDLHSVGQLYLGGPKDKVTTFIYAKKTNNNISVPKQRVFDELVNMINKKSAHDILEAILLGVKLAYKKKRLPYMEVELKDISEKSLGKFMQFKMIEMMYLGFLLNVHTFDQPNVESYKIETKNFLR